MPNPLMDIEIKDRENCIPFESIKAEHFLPALTSAYETARQDLQKLRESQGAPSFENTILELDFIREEMEFIANLYYVMLKVEADPQYRLISEKVSVMLKELNTSILTDEALFLRVSEVYKQECDGKPMPKPDFNDVAQMERCERYRYTEKTFKSFVSNGASLSADDKLLLNEIDKELSALGPRFSNNLAAAISAYELHLSDPAAVEGIPPWLLEEAGNLAKKRGRESGWVFNLQTSILLTVLNNCKNSATREKLQKAYASKAYKDDFDNQSIVRRILSLRKQRAQLLGYKNHVQYVLENRMLTDAHKVHAFLDRLHHLALPKARAEYQEVVDYARQTDGVEDFKFWDFNYYSSRLRESKFQVNLEDVRPWFSLPLVLDGVFILAQKLFGLKFVPVSYPQVYHKDVLVYEVYDEHTGYVGLIYLDLFIRESKRSGAWTNDLVSQGLHKTGPKRPIVISAINLVPPSAEKPTLLSLTEMRTLYMEFGHALHILLSNCHYSGLAGNNVLRDFLELPSQLMTRWLYEKEFLDTFARHYQTGEPLSTQFLQTVVAQNEDMKNTEIMGFLRFSALDLALHTAKPKQLENLNEFENKVIEPYMLTQSTSEDSNITCQFSHIFSGGYAASFYTYLWSESLVADIWAYIKSKGIFNRELSFALRDLILSRGNSVHPMDLFIAFRGQKPDAEAMIGPSVSA